MNKRLHKKQKHVLSVLRKAIGASLVESKSILGLSPDTVKSIQSGRLPFSERAAMTVAEKTGVSCKWLLALDGSKPPKTASGEPFTKDTFNRHELSRDKNARAWQSPMNFNYLRNSCLKQFRALTMKLAGLMLAAFHSQKVGFVDAKLDKEMRRLANVIRELGRVHAFKSARTFDDHGRMVSKSALWEQLENIPADSEAGLVAIFDKFKKELPAEKALRKSGQ